MSAGTTTTVPAMPNAHSHAFQWWLRGAAERPVPEAHAADDFWSWRRQMFKLAETLDPDGMREVAAQAYGEMARCGYGVVGEFHYVHHDPAGRPYAERNEMAIAVAEAAVEAGLEIVLIPAAYHRNGWDGGDRTPSSGQVRFCDPDVETFLERVEGLRAWASGRAGVRVGVAAHSVRAVPASWLEAIRDYSERHGLVRHVHASEQRRELAECEAEHGCSPIELLRRSGFLGPRTSVIHGIHVSDADVALLAESGAIVVSCPTTEGSLGDGHFPALAYARAGVRVAIGSDSQVRIDPFEEVREMETNARRQAERRYGPLAMHGDLWRELARNGRASLGLAEDERAGGTLRIDTEHRLLAGIEAEDLALALATCATADVVEALEPAPGGLR